MRREGRRRAAQWLTAVAVAVVCSTTALADPGFNTREDPRPPPPPRPMLDERLLIQGGDAVNASDALDEILDELAADVARIGTAAVSPILVERVEVSQNVDPTFAAILEARLITAVHRAASVAVLRCVECGTTQTRVENGVWVVKRGITSRGELVQLASSYGARTVLRAYFTLREDPDALALDVELARADDSTITFAEGYRFEPSTGLLYRGADSAETRKERLADLEDRIERKPHFGMSALMGAMLVPYNDELGPVLGGFGQFRLYEAFGAYRQHRIGLDVGAFMHSSRMAGAVIEVSLMTRLTEPSLYAPEFRAGVGVGGFLTGGGGNTPMGSVLLEYLFAHRLAVQASVSWIQPFNFAKKGAFAGGVTPQAGMAFVW